VEFEDNGKSRKTEIDEGRATAGQCTIVIQYLTCLGHEWHNKLGRTVAMKATFDSVLHYNKFQVDSTPAVY